MSKSIVSPRANSVNLPGTRYKNFVLVRRLGYKKTQQYWECLCDCGRLWEVAAGNFKRMSSCGCVRNHGMSGTKLWIAWQGMKSRCFNSQSFHYKQYGGRGITACKSIANSFQAFSETVGDPPSPQHSIDRIDNEKHYSCGQCEDCTTHRWTMNIRWASVEIQQNNRRNNLILELNGTKKTAAQWSRTTGLCVKLIYNRVRRGWSTEKTLTTPVLRKKQRR